MLLSYLHNQVLYLQKGNDIGMFVDSQQPTSWIDNPEMLNAFPTAVVICDEQGVICQANDELLQLFGYNSASLLGNPIHLLVPNALRQQHQHYFKGFINQPIKRNMGNGKALLGEKSDGTTFPLEVGLNPIQTANGCRIIATITDISHRYQLEQNFRSIIDAAPVAMLIVDQHGTIQHCNELLLSTFGYQQEELLNNPMERLLPERHRKAHPTQRQHYQQNSSPRAMGSGRDLTGRHKNGTEIPLEIGLNPIEVAEEKMVVAAISDISERKKAELRLKQAYADLDEFTYVASHDLKSPLRGINSLIEWIIEDLGETAPAKVAHNLERIQVRTARMEKLVDDLLDYAKSGHLQGDCRRFILKELIQGIIALQAPPLDFKITVEGYLGEIESVATPLETVLRNLISNAIKHHDSEQGQIEIKVDTEGSYCIFDVKDDGPGIPTAAAERVFKLFQTLSNKDGTRSGVGLAVCKRLVEAHGGKIELHTQDGHRGCHFRFWWPRFSRRDINDE